MCVPLAASVAATPRRLPEELVGAAIPFLMVFATAIAAKVAILSARTSDSRPIFCGAG